MSNTQLLSGRKEDFELAKTIAKRKGISLSAYMISLVHQDDTKSKVKELMEDVFPESKPEPKQVEPMTSHIPMNPDVIKELERQAQGKSTKRGKCLKCSFVEKENYFECPKCGHKIDSNGSPILEVTA